MDSFVVSARKYRPITFDTVVGQASITSTLKNAIKSNHLAQAFLFTGPRGVGKTTCARIFAKTINCTNLNDKMEPCDQCESCVSFNRNNSFNIHELDAASNNSVEDIRRLVEQVRIPPQVGNYKVYIIDEVHMLSQAAFNAFLKTLEEPPAYAKFILATTEKHKIIPTILSRCQIYDFNRITLKDIADYLAYIAKNEGVSVDPEVFIIMAQKADGALRDALSIFDQLVSYAGNHISYHDAIENLNVLDVDYYFRMVNYFLAEDISNSLLIFNEVIAKGFDGIHFINGLASHFRNILVSKDPQTVQLLETSENIRSQYAQQATQCSLRFLITAIDLCTAVDLAFKSASDKRLLIELNLMKICKIENPFEAQVSNEKKKPEINIPAPIKPTLSAAPAQATTISPQEVANSQFMENARSFSSTPKTPIAPTEASKVEQIKPTAPSLSTEPTRSRGISIKLSMEESKEEAPKLNLSQLLSTEYSSVDHEIQLIDLISAIEQYTLMIAKENPAFASSLRANNIELFPNNTILLKLDNQALDNMTLKYNLLQYLKQSLQNEQLTLKTEIKELSLQPQESNMEIYSQMVKQNPNLDLFREQLGLELIG